MIEASGLRVVKMEDNSAYAFLSDNARGASRKFGVGASRFSR
jgi:arsenite methyltransferase